MNPNVYALVLTDVLAACVDAYAQDGAPRLPKRAFTCHGQPPVEGEQLVVWSGGLSSTHPFPLAQLRAAKTTVVGSALVNIEVWRTCWPAPSASGVAAALPAPQAFTDATDVLARDAITLFGTLADLAVKGGLCPHLPGVSTASDVALGQMLPLGPQGTLAGWRWPMSVKLSVLPQ